MPPFDISKERVDPRLYVEGVWLPYKGSRMLIAAYNNPRHSAALAAAMRQYVDNQDEDGNIPEHLSQKADNQALAETIVLGWEDVVDAGEPVEHSTEAVLATLESCPEYRTWVRIQSHKVANFQAVAEGAEGKGSAS